MTKTYLDILPHELSFITDKDLIEPKNKIEEGDKEIGGMSEDIKKLFTYHQILGKEAALKIVEMEYGDPNDVTKKSEAIKAKSTLAILDHLLWHAINEELQTWAVDNLTIRKGWKIVQTKPKPGFGFGPFKIDLGGTPDA